MDALKVAKLVVRYSNPLGGLIADGFELAEKSMTSAASKGLDDLKIEAKKQEIRAEFDQQQAKTAQELAIAERISNAEEVHIEEFYDTTGKGNVGISLDADSATVGVGASGRHVVKRIYKFTGWRAPVEEIASERKKVPKDEANAPTP